MAKIIFLDSYYPQVFDSLPMSYDYQSRVKSLANLKFGTADYYSEAFRSYGWEVEDVVVNDQVGIGLLAKYQNSPTTPLNDYLLSLKPDVLYFQDLSLFDWTMAEEMREVFGTLIVSQHSCPWAGNTSIKNFDLVFTSFPHYIPRIQALGVRSEFLQIGFGGEYVPVKPKLYEDRSIEIGFVGGLGGGRTRGHWSSGTDLFEAVAEKFPSFKWWGYGVENVGQALRRAYQGPAWGQDMYSKLADMKICLNRHGEVAEGYTNNMRCFEATGMGCHLFTEQSKNLDSYFSSKEVTSYQNQADLLSKIKYALENPSQSASIAAEGRKATLSRHTYKQILRPVADTLRCIVDGRNK